MLAGYLRERAAAVLGVPAAAIASQPLTALGLDSLSAVELKGGVEAALGFRCRSRISSRGSGWRTSRQVLLAGLDGEPAADDAPLRALSLAGDQPLSPGQRGLWFLHRLAPEGGAYNIAVAARDSGAGHRGVRASPGRARRPP